MNGTGQWKDLGNSLPRPIALPFYSRSLFNVKGKHRQTERHRDREKEGDSMWVCLREIWINHMHPELALVSPEGASGYMYSGETAFPEPWLLEARMQSWRSWALVLLSVPDGTVLHWGQVQVKNQKSSVFIKFLQLETQEISVRVPMNSDPRLNFKNRVRKLQQDLMWGSVGTGMRPPASIHTRPACFVSLAMKSTPQSNFTGCRVWITGLIICFK